MSIKVVPAELVRSPIAVDPVSPARMGLRVENLKHPLAHTGTGEDSEEMSAR